MKRAVIVVGHHHAGKSKTIRRYFKPMIGLPEHRRFCRVSDSEGAVLSQSLEERRKVGAVLSQTLEENGRTTVREFLAKYGDLSWLVLASRPESEGRSLYSALRAGLERLGFVVARVVVVKGNPEEFYRESAAKIYRHIFRSSPTRVP